MHAVFVGFACNNRCLFCAQGELRSRAPSSALAFAEEDLAEVTAGSTVAFIGGEPTLFHELPDWVRRARARGATQILVQTNGRRLAEPDYALELRDAGVTRVDVSLHGSTAAMHDFHTARAGSFEDSCRGIRAAAKGGLGVGVTTVVTRANFRHLQEIVRLSAELGASAVHLAVAQSLGSAAPGPNRPVPPAAAAPPLALLRPHWARALAAARSLDLPCVAAGVARESYRGAEGWFAGIGVVDAPASS